MNCSGHLLGEHTQEEFRNVDGLAGGKSTACEWAGDSSEEWPNVIPMNHEDENYRKQMRASTGWIEWMRASDLGCIAQLPVSLHVSIEIFSGIWGVTIFILKVVSWETKTGIMIMQWFLFWYWNITSLCYTSEIFIPHSLSLVAPFSMMDTVFWIRPSNSPPMWQWTSEGTLVNQVTKLQKSLIFPDPWHFTSGHHINSFTPINFTLKSLGGRRGTVFTSSSN